MVSSGSPPVRSDGYLAAHLCADHAVDIADGQDQPQPAHLVPGGLHSSNRTWRSMVSPVCDPAVMVQRRPTSGDTCGWYNRAERIQKLGLSSDPTARRGSSLSVRPIISSTVRKPSRAIHSRISVAIKYIKVHHVAGIAAEILAQLGVSAWHTVGQVSRWQTRSSHSPRATAARWQTQILPGAQQRPRYDVPARLELAVRFNHNSTAQIMSTRVCWTSARPVPRATRRV